MAPGIKSFRHTKRRIYAIALRHRAQNPFLLLCSYACVRAFVYGCVCARAQRGPSPGIKPAHTLTRTLTRSHARTHKHISLTSTFIRRRKPFSADALFVRVGSFVYLLRRPRTINYGLFGRALARTPHSAMFCAMYRVADGAATCLRPCHHMLHSGATACMRSGRCAVRRGHGCGGHALRSLAISLCLCLR